MIPKATKEERERIRKWLMEGPRHNPPDGREGRARLQTAHQDPGRAAVPHRDKGKAGSALLSGAVIGRDAERNYRIPAYERDVKWLSKKNPKPKRSARKRRD